MELLTGPVKMVRHKAEVYGDKDGVGTSQGVTFRVNNRAVEMWSPVAPQIEEGDEVSVAGDLADGVLKGRAYFNHSSGAVGRTEKYHFVTDLIIKHAYGAVVAVALVLFVGPLGVLCFPLIWAYWAYLLADELKTRRAVRAVRDVPTRVGTR